MEPPAAPSKASHGRIARCCRDVLRRSRSASRRLAHGLRPLPLPEKDQTNMFDMHRVELNWAGRKLVLETGRVARQADGAVLATYGETTVLATVVSSKTPKPGVDFFPLTVNYQEKAFAAGRIPGGYFKREGRPSERETLTSRLIDRPIRPLFPDGFRCDTQVIATVFSYDLETDSAILAMIASS